MVNKLDTRAALSRLTPWQAGLGLVLFFTLAGPVWAPMNPGWCKNNTLITTSANLAFGAFAAIDLGLINVDTLGNRTFSGSIVLMGGTVSAAAFSISGCANSAYSIVLPPTTTLTSGTASMTISTFQTNPTGSGVLDANGAGSITLGGTLNVNALQTVGAYSGTFTMEIVLQ